MNNKSIYIIYINILTIFHVPNVQGCLISNEKETESSHSSRTVADRHVLAQLLFLQEQVLFSGSRRKGIWGASPSSPLELAAQLALDEVGRWRDCQLRRRLGSPGWQDKLLGWGWP